MKQVLNDGGVGDSVAALFSGVCDVTASPLMADRSGIKNCAWFCDSSRFDNSGLVIPLMHGSDVNVALMVLATGAGSLIASHVNYTGFWIFKEYFDLTMKETFATWTPLETVISVSGLVFVLILSIFV